MRQGELKEVAVSASCLGEQRRPEPRDALRLSAMAWGGRGALNGADRVGLWKELVCLGNGGAARPSSINRGGERGRIRLAVEGVSRVERQGRVEWGRRERERGRVRWRERGSEERDGVRRKRVVGLPFMGDGFRILPAFLPPWL